MISKFSYNIQSTRVLPSDIGTQMISTSTDDFIRLPDVTLEISDDVRVTSIYI